MSVFCSNTLIFAPECWTYILRGPGFQNFFQKLAPLVLTSWPLLQLFPSPPTAKLLLHTVNKILLKTLD